MIGHELYPLDGFIDQRLTGDATLMSLLPGGGVHVDKEPEGFSNPSTAPPIVTFTFVSGVDTSTVGAGSRIMTQVTYLVKAVTREIGYHQAHPIAKRIDQLLLGASGQVPAENLFVLGTEGIEPIRYPETLTGGISFSHLGRRYRFILSAIS